jgi:hypothetical protein
MAETTMAAPELTGAETAPPGASRPVSRWRYAAYCLVVVALPAIFLLSSLFIVRSKNFLSKTQDPFLMDADYPYSLNNANCDILIFGDSTAVTGVDPTVIESATGLKSCNIAQSQSIVALLGTDALDHYLSSNQAPKYLVIDLAPESFSRGGGDFFWPEGLTLLVRRQMGVRTLLTLALHPKQSYGFALWAIKVKLGLLGVGPDFSSMQATFQSRHGLLVLPKPPETACMKKGSPRPPTTSWISELRQKYSTNGTHVIIDVAPLPDCTGDAAQIAASLSGLTDNVLPLYPIHLFSDIDRHLTLEGAERESAEIARQILVPTRKQ